ncbi:MAG: alpha/beta hydrolase [Saprospiraceae bacterium]
MGHSKSFSKAHISDNDETKVIELKTDETNATNSKTQFAETGGRKIAYRSIGQGKPMILCQRFRGNLDDWDPSFLNALAKHFNVITFDYTGFASSTGTPPENILDFAKDVKDLAGALKLKKMMVGGWSFGGCVAQIVATEFPDMVSQLILMGTRPPGQVNHPMEDIFLKTAYKPQNDFEDEVILFFEPASKASRAAAKSSHKRMAKRTTDNDIPVKQELWQFYGKGMEDFGNDGNNALQKLTKTKIPILVITADHEICFPPENWFELNRKLPTAQVMVFPQAGHGPHHQYPKLIARYIASFIKYNKKAAKAN